MGEIFFLSSQAPKQQQWSQLSGVMWLLRLRALTWLIMQNVMLDSMQKAMGVLCHKAKRSTPTIASFTPCSTGVGPGLSDLCLTLLLSIQTKPVNTGWSLVMAIHIWPGSERGCVPLYFLLFIYFFKYRVQRPAPDTPRRSTAARLTWCGVSHTVATSRSSFWTI